MRSTIYISTRVACLLITLGISYSTPVDKASCVEKCQAFKPNYECPSHCENALKQGFDYCRQPNCLKSMECMSVCRITGQIPYNRISAERTICMRSFIQPDQSIATEFYWLPVKEVDDFRKLQYINLLVNDVIDHSGKYQDLIAKYLISHSKPNMSLVFPVSPMNYSVDISYGNVSFGVDGRHRENPTSLWFHLYSPNCSTGLTYHCNDTKYAVASMQEYYHPVVTKIGKKFSSPEAVNITCANRRDGLAYKIKIRVPVVIALEEYYNLEPTLSCWCWSSCQIIHNVTITYRINATIHSTSMVLSTSPKNMTTVRYTEKEEWNLTFPVMMEDHVSTEYELIVQVSAQSYFKADKYFGPRYATTSKPRHTTIKVQGLFRQFANIIASDDVCPTPSPITTLNTLTSSPATPSSPTWTPKDPTLKTLEAKSDNTDMVIIPITIVISFFFGIALGVFVYFRQRIPPCIKHTRTPELKKRSQIRLQVGVHRDNDNYHINRQDWKDWPLVDRNKIELVKMLGGGQFGEVHMAFAQDIIPEQGKIQVAVKMLRPEASARDEQDFINEGGYLRKFRHPNIVRLLGVCLEKEPKMLVLELMDGGDLLTYLQENKPGPTRLPWDDSEYVDISLDIAAGLKYLEKEKFVHRDVAARNCLVSFSPLNGSLPVNKPSSSGRIVKIGDFGLARDIFDIGSYTSRDDKAMLPLRWMAPESLLHRVYDGKTDIWSFGILLWEVFTYGEMPYGAATTVFDVYRFVTMGGTLKQPQFAPNAMFKVMDRCWQNNPQRRPTFKELHNLLLTFQKSLTRRKTLMTTLASFASIGGPEEVRQDESGKLPDIPAPQFLQVPHGISVASGNVFEDSDCFEPVSDVSGTATPNFELESDDESRDVFVFASTDSVSYSSLADRRRKRFEQQNTAACSYSPQPLNSIGRSQVIIIPSISIQPENQLSPILGSPTQTDMPRDKDTPTHVNLNSPHYSESSL